MHKPQLKEPIMTLSYLHRIFSSGLISLFTVLTPVLCAGQVKVTQLTDSTAIPNKGAVIYNLPQTRLIIDILLLKTSQERGLFYEYTREFLNIDEYVTRNSVEYGILSLTVTTVAEPDPSQFYSVEKIRRFPWVSRQKGSLTLTKDGFLCAYNQADKRDLLDSSPGILQFGQRAVSKKEPVLPVYHINDALLSHKADAPKVDSTIRLPLRKPIYKVETKDIPLIEKARITLDDLYQVRQDRQNLAGGYQEVPYDPGTMNFMIKQLYLIEKELLNQFTGKTSKDTLKFRVSVIPISADSMDYNIAWLHPQNGISAQAAEGAIPLIMSLTTQPFPENKVIKETKMQASRGLVYRMPASSKCCIRLKGEIIYSGQHLINQSGKNVVLPKQVKRALFYPETGGIKSVK